jgi:protein-L-isoaspartate(D-aspartate) O-methyltransferase
MHDAVTLPDGPYNGDMVPEPAMPIGPRLEMISKQLEARGIRQQSVLDAMAMIPRERFIPLPLRALAYADRAVPIECGQTISQPYIVAYMTEQLDLQPHHRVLEIGTGSGYQTAVLSGLCDRVYTVELSRELSRTARQRLQTLAVDNVIFRHGDGGEGWSGAAPFDRIVVTAACPLVPGPLVDQLEDGGVLVVPVGEPRIQQLMRLERQGGRVIERELIGCRFVKLTGAFGWSETSQDKD